MIKNFKELRERVKSSRPLVVSVAAAADTELLLAVKAAVDDGFIQPVLTGDKEKIEDICRQINLVPTEILGAETETEAVERAVREVHNGNAQVLMKGLVNTSIYMRGILNREWGLRTGRLLSMMAAYDAPGYAPGLEQKKDILKNLLYAVENMGIHTPKVAVLTANEMVDPKVPSTMDAAGLVEAVKTEDGFLPCIIEGPIAFDVAFDPQAAAHKKIDSKITGDVDLVIFPNIEAGNIMGKSWIHLCHSSWAGIVLGASNPVILGSRSDTAEIKMNSIALACLAAQT